MGLSNFLKNSLSVILFAILITFAYADEDMLEPRKNDNLSPVQSWRSAVECMFNKSTNCTAAQQLSLNLTLEVAQADAAAYCRQGCLNHTLAVLDCIDDVKRDFWFANEFGTWALRRFITTKCDNLSGFSYKDVPSGGVGLSQKMVLSIMVPLLASVYAMAFSDV